MEPIIKKLYELYKRKKEILVDLKGFLEPISEILKQQSLAYMDEYRKKIDDHTPFHRHRDVKYWLDQFSKVNKELGQYEDEDGNTIIVETRLAAIANDAEIVGAYQRLMGFVAREQEVIQELDDAIAEIMAREDWDKWVSQLHEYYTLIQILNQDIKLFTLLLRKIWQKHLLDEVVSQGYEKLRSAGRLNVIAINLEKMLGFGDGDMLKVAMSLGFDARLNPFNRYPRYEGNPCIGIWFQFYRATGEIYRFGNTEQTIERKNLVVERFIVAVDFRKRNPYYKIVNLDTEYSKIYEYAQKFEGRDLASSNLRKSILLYNERAQTDASDEFFSTISSAIESAKMADRERSVTFPEELLAQEQELIEIWRQNHVYMGFIRFMDQMIERGFSCNPIGMPPLMLRVERVIQEITYGFIFPMPNGTEREREVLEYYPNATKLPIRNIRKLTKFIILSNKEIVIYELGKVIEEETSTRESSVGSAGMAMDTSTFFNRLFTALRDERFDDAERIIISAIKQLTTPQPILDVYELAFLRGLVVVHIKNHNFEQAATNLDSENINQFDFGPGIVDELKRIVEELRRRHRKL